jgi:hypothetical protein
MRGVIIEGGLNWRLFMTSQDKLFYLFIFIGAGGIFLFHINETSIHQYWLELCSYVICGISIVTGIFLFLYKNDRVPLPFKTYAFFILISLFGVGLGFFASYVVHQRWLGIVAFFIAVIGFGGVFFSYFSVLGVMAQGFIDWIKSIFNWFNPSK